MACVILMLLSFVKFHLKRINFDDRSKSLAAILIFSISQNTVTTKLELDGNLCHRYMKNFLGNLSVKEFFWSTFAEATTKSRESFLRHSAHLHIASFVNYDTIDLIMKAIFGVEYVLTSEFDVVPSNCQPRASLPAVVIMILSAFLHSGRCRVVTLSSFHPQGSHCFVENSMIVSDVTLDNAVMPSQLSSNTGITTMLWLQFKQCYGTRTTGDIAANTRSSFSFIFTARRYTSVMCAMAVLSVSPSIGRSMCQHHTHTLYLNG